MQKDFETWIRESDRRETIMDLMAHGIELNLIIENMKIEYFSQLQLDRDIIIDDLLDLNRPD